jgi:hypothetical protein
MRRLADAAATDPELQKAKKAVLDDTTTANWELFLTARKQLLARLGVKEEP